MHLYRAAAAGVARRMRRAAATCLAHSHTFVAQLGLISYGDTRGLGLVSYGGTRGHAVILGGVYYTYIYYYLYSRTHITSTSIYL